MKKGTLRIVTSNGSDAPFLNFFKVVDGNHSNSSCGTALKQDRRITAGDIGQSSLFAGTESGEVLRAARVRRCNPRLSSIAWAA
jgi:hypothetical protein